MLKHLLFSISFATLLISWPFDNSHSKWCDDISLGFALYFSDESESEVAQSCPTLCNPKDCSLPGSSSIHGIFQAKILEWVAIFFSRGSSWPQGSNSGLPHCRQTLYPLSHEGIPDDGDVKHLFMHLWPSACLHWKNVYSDPLPIFYLYYVFC